MERSLKSNFGIVSKFWFWITLETISPSKVSGDIIVIRYNKLTNKASVYFECFQNCEKRLLALSCLSVRPSVHPSPRPHSTTLLPPEGFSWNLMFECFSKMCRKKIEFHYNLTRMTGTLHKDLYTFTIFFSCYRLDPIPYNGLPLRGFAITLVEHIKLGVTPLDKWSVRRRDFYLTTHSIHNIKTSMLGRTRIHNSSKRAAADPLLKPWGHWNWQIYSQSIYQLN